MNDMHEKAIWLLSKVILFRTPSVNIRLNEKGGWGVDQIKEIAMFCFREGYIEGYTVNSLRDFDSVIGDSNLVRVDLVLKDEQKQFIKSLKEFV